MAYRQHRSVARELSVLCERIDSEGARAESSELADELDEILVDVFQEERRGVSVLGVNELVGRAALLRAQVSTLAKGVARIPFLCGGAGAISVFALGGLSRDALALAGAAIGVGFISSFSGQAYSKRSRQLARKYSNVIESLSRQVDLSWDERGSHGLEGVQ